MVAPEPTSRLIAELPSANRRLLDTVTQLSDDSVLRPSLLPGWTVGHVLSHIARNADALVNLCDWARTGVRKPMYVSMEAREADIADGAARPLPEQLKDIADSEARLLERFENLPADAWAVEVSWPSGAVRTASQVVTARLNELEVHHVDLGLGYTFDDVPAGSRDALLTYTTSRWPSGFPVVLESSDTTWSSPVRPAGARIVTGGSAALLSWVLGRSDGSELGREPGGALPEPPPWG
ncbi:maleylpyruvate isomerase family mycothiol-dependent enzyme [Streptomyces sp. SID13031]|uniref:maleylpyruvate isomerase family mycothiol-dependent enzyme n=1 Tax=Streptomyces sp. SID13031 TaxID=2706046 RepID=UPI0013CB60DC|nr:maleylpyruvate isomerase family mycothiol-dependent enzyme [Streptomyces sp. SID13031]NEA30834.1 maleylpyruvate isomerase family mycothiol-dependent enzyme [Streptomyces sp. SID13031]